MQRGAPARYLRGDLDGLNSSESRIIGHTCSNLKKISLASIDPDLNVNACLSSATGGKLYHMAWLQCCDTTMGFPLARDH